MTYAPGVLRGTEGGHMSVIVEIRAAEGGVDSKSLVETLYGAYVRRCTRSCL